MTDLHGMPDPIIFETNSESDFYSTILEDLLLSIKESISQRNLCVIGLSGGTTPEKLYQLLSAENLPWEKLFFITVDERYVASDDPESNLKMIRKALFAHAPIPPENIITFDTSLPIESAAKEMHRKLTSIHLDILILGVGEDGHIASLFDNDKTSDDLASTATAKGYKTEQRLTLTLKALNSGKTLILMKGEKKRAIFDEIKSGTSSHTALNKILQQDFVKLYYSV